MTDYPGKKTAMEIAFGRIQGIVEELKDDPTLKQKMMLSQQSNITEHEEDSKDLKNTETSGFEGDEDTPQMIVQEGQDDESEDHINVLNKDRSYMLSYIISKQKDEGTQETFKRTSERIRTQFLSKLVY